MTNNTLGDLNNFLFGQLERLDNPELSQEQLKHEVERTKAMTHVASKIIHNANTVLSAQKFAAETYGRSYTEPVPKMLEGK